jgi:hypothetical protein
MVQLTQTEVLADAGDIHRLKEEFAETGTARLPAFLAPEILSPFLRWVANARFNEKNEVHKGRVFGTTLFVPENDPALFLLQFVLNRQPLFHLVESVSGCPQLGSFLGRIHTTNAGSNHHIDWHDDAVEGRTVGITIHLSPERYEGGVLQVRDPEMRIRSEMGWSAPGDAFLFRINRGWEHKLTGVESGSRTVGVGWFRTEPDFRLGTSAAVRSLQILAAGNREQAV